LRDGASADSLSNAFHRQKAFKWPASSKSLDLNARELLISYRVQLASVVSQSD
jgi:hypothetical protein